MIRQRDFTIDTKLKAAVQKDYAKWLTKEWMGKATNFQRFMGYLKTTLERERKKMDDVQQMLQVMDELRFNHKFGPIIEELPAARDAMVDTLSQVQNEHLMNETIAGKFQQSPFNYPHLPVVPVDVDADYSRKTKVLEEKIKNLEDEVMEKDEYIAKIEDQANRLLTEKKNLRQQLDEMKQKLEDQDRMKQNLDALADSKQKLAESTASTINELREYLVKYQEALIEATTPPNAETPQIQ